MAPKRDLARALYRRLLRLYPRAFRDQLGESMEQTFADLRAERPAHPGVVLRLYAETVTGLFAEHAHALTGGQAMKTLLANPRSVALLSLLLTLPGALMFALLFFNVEPPLGPLGPMLKAQPGRPAVLGSLIALTLVVVLPALGFVLSLQPVLRGVRAGQGWLAQPLVFWAGAAALAVVLAFVVGVVVDQYPCWVGVPNCD